MRVTSFIGCAIGTFSVVGLSFADDFTWENSNNDIFWDSASGNWSLGGLPTLLIPDADDNVFFNTDLLGSNAPFEANLNGNREVQTANLLGDGGFTITGNVGDRLSLGTGDLNAALGSDVDPHTIEVDVRLLDSAVWDIGAAASGGATLHVTGAINTANSNVTFTKIGDGTLRVAELNADTFVTVDGGTLELDAGGQMTSAFGVIGDTPGSAGTIRVTGAGATWTNSLDVTVGNDGAGVLSIEDGGTVTANNTARIGQEAGSTGEVTVTGAGSTWNHTSTLILGDGGEGTLSVESGATASSESAFVGLDVGSSGSANVSGAGSTWSVTNALAIGASGEGSVRIEDGGTVSSDGGLLGLVTGAEGDVTVTGAGSNWTNSGELSVGSGGLLSGGSGTLLIENGGAVSNTTGTVGDGDGTVGVATVTGTDSTWTNSTLIVGGSGDGTLTIADGAAASGSVVIVGDESGSTGATTVTGADSTLTSSFNVSIGDSGTGTLRVENGGAVDSRTGIDTIGRFAGSLGQATITGAGSTWSNLDSLYVGDEGTGTLRVEDGGTMSNRDGFIASSADSVGEVTVTGADSKWTNNGGLIIGEEGNGTLLIENGGSVSDVGAIIGDESGSEGQVTVSGSDSAWTSISVIGVGGEGKGTLRVEDGGEVISVARLAIGSSGGSTGEVTVTGVDSVLDAGLELSVGDEGSGTLLIENGGTARATNRSQIGESAGGVGVTTVRGAGSSLTTPLDLIVGVDGTGTLIVEEGAAASSRDAAIGQDLGSIGTVNVTGAGSTWTTSRSVYVGGSNAQARGTGTVNVSDNALTAIGGTLTIWDDGSVTQDTGSTLLVDDTVATATPTEGTIIGNTGSGTLLVTGGGQLSSTTGYLGFLSGSTGNATVTGDGSAWANDGSLTVGSLGDGTLLVEDGAQLSSVGASLGQQIGATGDVTVTGSGSTWTNTGNVLLAGGLDTRGTLTIQDGGQVSNADAFLSLSSDAFLGSTATVDVTGAGSAWISSGSVYVGGNDTSARGDATVTLSDNATMAVGGTLTVWDDGTVNQNSNATLLVDDAVTTASDNDETFIGDSGNGTLLITGGGQLVSTGATVGRGGNANGTSTVTGAGSAWTISDNLTIGDEGNGTLRIEDGATVSNASGTLGNRSDSSGSVTVTGSGSTWTNDNRILVGLLGQGTLRVEDGAEVSSAGGVIGPASQGSGHVTVTGSGSIWINSDELGMAELINGNARLTIQDGGQVFNTRASLGFENFTSPNLSSTSRVSVTGTDSAWINSGNVYVGGNRFGAGGDATVTISDNALIAVGGTLTIYEDGTVTQNTSATLLIDNTVTTPTIIEGTVIGDTGAGNLSIQGGGQLSSTDAFLGLLSGSTGNATVTGAGSIWTSSGGVYVGGSDTAAGGTASLTLSDNATMTVGGSLTAWDAGTVNQNNTATLLIDDATTNASKTNATTIGGTGNGSLQITGGGQVSGTDAFLGLNAGSTGTATVSGEDSAWDNSGDVYVGGSDTAAGGTATVTLNDNASMAVGGSLTIWDSGTVVQNDTTTLLVDDAVGTTLATGAITIGDTGAGALLITGGGSLTGTASALGINAGSSGEATVTGTNSSWNAGTVLVVGLEGTGTLLIENAGEVTSPGFTIMGDESGSVSHLTVTGAGSTLSTGLVFSVADEGNSTLLIEDGGTVVSSRGADIGNLAGGVGMATVRGAGSTWTNDDDLDVGDEGTGTLLIENGGAVSSVASSIGKAGGSIGDVTVTGAGSNLTALEDLDVGFEGTGTLQIEDGGTVSSGYMTLGFRSSGLGETTVTGAGSTLAVTEDIQVGGSQGGSGTLRIADGGSVSSGEATIGHNSGSVGEATVTGAGSSWTITDSGLDVGFSGMGTLRIEDGGTVTDVDATIGDQASSTGIATVTGSGSSWTNSSGLQVGGEGAGTLLIEDGGVVSSGSAIIALGSGSTGDVTVTGAGSAWTINESLFLALAFDGSAVATLLVEDGGSVSNVDATIASNTGSVGVVTVTGDDSRWDSSGGLTIGQNGDATLNLNSGTVSAAGLSFGAGTATLNLLGGRLELVGDQTLGSDVLSILSPALTSPNHTFAVTGALTLEDTFTIDGANVEVGRLNIDELASVDGQSGSLLAEVLQLSDGASLDLSDPGLIGTDDFDLTIGTLEIAGIVRGSGTFDLATGVDVTSTGEVRVAAGESAYFAGFGLNHANSGRLEIIGNPITAGNAAELEFDGVLTNNADGHIAGLGMTARFNGGLINEGVFSVSFGTSNIFGNIDNTGSIGLAGNAQVTFFDDLNQNGVFNIGSGSTAVVFGDFTGSGGTINAGTLEILGTFSPGNSPDVVSFGGDLNLSSSLGTLIELGGLGLGEFDRNIIAGLLTLGGDLTVELFGGHALGLNQTYEVFAAGVLSGTFDNLGDGDLVGVFNGVDLFIDYDIDAGSVTLFTVPEPGAAVLMGLGVLLIGSRQRNPQTNT